jgi:hypothetical protein
MFDLNIELNMIVAEEVRPYRGPILFDRSGTRLSEDNVFTNGGFTLVDTGERKILVTCYHVWDEFLNERSKDARVRILVCLEYGNNLAVFNDYQPIDLNRELDIATFDMAPVMNACPQWRKFYPLRQDPPHALRNGEELVAVGNPGRYRTFTDEGVHTGATVYGIKVTSVGELRFHADISTAKTTEVKKHTEQTRSPDSSPHGGISGSPCFLYRTDRRCVLVGIATGEHRDNLCFSHIGCLNADGTIKRHIIDG